MAHILVIDDDGSIRCLLRIALEHYGYRVSEASNGYEGLQCYKTAPADLVITDMQMPVMNGLQLLAKLHQEFPSARVIAISGVSTALHAAKDFNVRHTFMKPFTLEALLKAVQETTANPEPVEQRL